MKKWVKVMEMWNQAYHEKHKVFSLYGRLLDYNRLVEAWKRVKRNKGAGGVDRVTIEMFESQRDLHLQTLLRRLQEKTYRPQPVLRRQIKKKDSDKLRNLGIPTILDRIVQQALKDLLEPIFDPHFSSRSHGYRPGHSAHNALTDVEVFRQHFDWVVDADIKGFFDNVDHEILLDLVSERVSDGSILNLIRMFLEAGVFYDDIVHESERGTPQGGVISPLLANIYLNHLDRQLTEEEIFFVRYADDFVVFCRSSSEADATLTMVRGILENDLHLELSIEKTKIVCLGCNGDITGFRIPDQSTFSYLGFRVSKDRIIPSDLSIKQFKDKIRAETIRSRTYEVNTWFDRMNAIIRGWANYFRIGKVSTLYPRLDGWIRDRVRLNLGHRTQKVRYNRRWLTYLRDLYRNSVLKEMGLITLQSLLGC